MEMTALLMHQDQRNLQRYKVLRNIDKKATPESGLFYFAVRNDDNNRPLASNLISYRWKFYNLATDNPKERK